MILVVYIVHSCALLVVLPLFTMNLRQLFADRKLKLNVLPRGTNLYTIVEMTVAI